jgi:hypothetical protein
VKSESWRLEADHLLINVAQRSLHAFTGKAGKYICIGESATTQEEYCLVALQALLSSLLSPSHVRPPYLLQGLEIFLKGTVSSLLFFFSFASCMHQFISIRTLHIELQIINFMQYPSTSITEVPFSLLAKITNFRVLHYRFFSFQF